MSHAGLIHEPIQMREPDSVVFAMAAGTAHGIRNQSEFELAGSFREPSLHDHGTCGETPTFPLQFRGHGHTPEGRERRTVIALLHVSETCAGFEQVAADTVGAALAQIFESFIATPRLRQIADKDIAIIRARRIQLDGFARRLQTVLWPPQPGVSHGELALKNRLFGIEPCESAQDLGRGRDIAGSQIRVQGLDPKPFTLGNPRSQLESSFIRFNRVGLPVGNG